MSLDQKNGRLAHLDLVRGLAAIAVCAGHIRGFLFVDWPQIERAPTGLDYIFYFSTGLGYQAVIVFFVLSGFLVGGDTSSAWASDRWSGKRYAIRRISRLETVLVPALVLTAVWDGVGRFMTSGVGYDGAFLALVNSGPSPERPLANGLVPFLGNLAFLMTIVVPVYGTNGPLWSLANEFWYYVIFPLTWMILFRPGLQRVMCIGALLLISIWLPAGILAAGTIWLMGYGAWYACSQSSFRILALLPLWPAFASGLFLLCLYGSRTGSWFGADFYVGLSAALFVTALAVRKVNGVSFYAKAGKTMADISYTLYLFHFPFVSFLWFCCFAPTQFQPDSLGYGVFVFVLLITLGYAYAMWWCFERHTATVRRFLEQISRKW